MKEIIFIENDSELGAGTRGASLGIGALKTALLNSDSDLFAKHRSIKIETYNDQLWNTSSTQHAIRIQHIAKVFDNVGKAIHETVCEGAFPLVLAGDHSSAGGTISGLKRVFPDKRIGAIWVDAHADLHTPYTTPSGNVHGMPLASALQIDNTECQRNTPTEESIKYWNELKGCGGCESKLLPEDLVFIAVRDTEKEEDDIIARHNIRNFKVEEVREKGAETVANEALQYLKACDVIYVSFDVDSMDCNEVSRGTGTPVENGLTEQEAADILNILIGCPRTACYEMVEINPCLDNKTNTMAETAARILESNIKVLKERFYGE